MRKVFQKRKGFNLTILLLLNLLVVFNVFAKETEIKPFVKGSFKQIKLENKTRPYIVTFWSENCAFCMKELALFGQVLKKYPKVKLISITTDPFLKEQVIKDILSSKGLHNVQKWVFADAHVERLYFDVARGWRGELPLTYFSDINNKLVKHLGVIKKMELNAWLELQE